jgi:ribonuclease P protein component
MPPMGAGDERLRAQKEINQLFREGAAYHGKLVVLILRQPKEGPRKVLFVASRRVGNAVRRNRAKRVMREAYRSLAPHLKNDRGHLAWVARARCGEAGMMRTRTDMVRLLAQAGLWDAAAELS